MALPLGAVELVQPAGLVALQLVALVLVQLRVLLPPLGIVEGVAVKLRVGGATVLTVTVAACVTLPPAPVQVRL